MRGAGYIFLEYFASAALVFAIGALLFGICVLVLISREGTRQLVASSHRLGEHAKLVAVQLKSSKLFPRHSPQQADET